MVVQWLHKTPFSLNVEAPDLIPDQRTRSHLQQLRVRMVQQRFTCHDLEFMLQLKTLHATSKKIPGAETEDSNAAPEDPTCLNE